MHSRRASDLQPLRTVSVLTSLSLVTLFLAGAGTTVPGLTVDGSVRLLEGRDDKTSTEFRSALVWFEPERAVPVQAPDEPYEMVTVRKEFQPKVMPVPVGSKVSFPNQDPILHNVFSISGPNRFDLGLYRGGEAKEAHFRQPGVVRVFCNVHHSMVAYVAVLDTPFFGRIGRDGAFRLEGVPAGPGRLTIWHDRADAEVHDLVLPVNSPVRLDLALTKEQIPRHRNKFGKPYERTRRGKAY